MYNRTIENTERAVHSCDSWLAWAWLAKPKANVVIPKNQPLPKYYLRKTKKVESAKYRLLLRYKKPVKITIYLGLDIKIKLKFTQILTDVQY